jgi:hypothetical protein
MNALDLCSESTWFQSEPSYTLFCLGSLIVFPHSLRRNAGIVLWPLVCKYLSIHHLWSYMHLIWYCYNLCSWNSIIKYKCKNRWDSCPKQKGKSVRNEIFCSFVPFVNIHMKERLNNFWKFGSQTNILFSRKNVVNLFWYLDVGLTSVVILHARHEIMMKK